MRLKHIQHYQYKQTKIVVRDLLNQPKGINTNSSTIFDQFSKHQLTSSIQLYRVRLITKEKNREKKLININTTKLTLDLQQFKHTKMRF